VLYCTGEYSIINQSIYSIIHNTHSVLYLTTLYSLTLTLAIIKTISYAISNAIINQPSTMHNHSLQPSSS